MKVKSEAPSVPEAEFLGKSIKFYKIKDGEYGAFLPVDMETEPGNYIIDIKSEGLGLSMNVKVKPFDFPTKHITLPDRKVTLNEKDSKRVEKEYLLQEKVWKTDSDKQWNGGFISPTNTKVTEVYGIKRIMNKKRTTRHRGIDLKGKSGAPIKAINSGKVVLREDLFYGGNTVVVDHGMGLLSVYMHMSKFNVKEGDEVSKGDVIGFVGSTGRSTGPHLHMSIKLNGVSVNPEALMKLNILGK